MYDLVNKSYNITWTLSVISVHLLAYYVIGFFPNRSEAAWVGIHSIPCQSRLLIALIKLFLNLHKSIGKSYYIHTYLILNQGFTTHNIIINGLSLTLTYTILSLEEKKKININIKKVWTKFLEPEKHSNHW